MRAEYREEPCRGALNRVKGMDFDWSLNPYMGCAHQCTYCYVRWFEQRADRPFDDRYGSSIRVKVNIVQVLRQELARPSWQREEVVIGAATDPYQPAEGRYRLTRGCLEALSERRNPFGIITRGPLIVRDIDVLQEASRRADVTVNVSIPTLDLDVWQKTEPGTATPMARMKTIRRLVDAGIDAGVAVAPILPGISDKPEQLDAVVRAARDAGATRLWSIVLHLQPGTREHFLRSLEHHWPEQLPRYERLFSGRTYLPPKETRPITAHVAGLRAKHGVGDRRALKLLPPPEPIQLDLPI